MNVLKWSKKSLTFEKKIYLSLILMVLAVLPLIYFAISSLLTINDERIKLNEHSARALTLAGHLRYNQTNEDRLVLDFILTGNAESYSEIKKMRADFRDTILKVEGADPSSKTRIQTQNILVLKRALEESNEYALAMKKIGRSPQVVVDYLNQSSRTFHMALTASLEDFFQTEVNRFGEARTRVNTATQHLIRTLFILALFSGAGFFMVMTLIMRLAHTRQIHENYREQLLEQSKKTAQARKEVLEAVSHDLRNPLTAIELSLEIMLRQMPEVVPSNKQKKQVETALRSANSMKNLIQHLLDQAKLEAGALQLSLERNNLADVIENQLVVLSPLLQQKQIQLNIEMDELVPEFKFDQKRIEQVVANILGNAIKFSSAQGKISIKMTMNDDEVKLTVTDTGKQGTGLGLAISKAIIEAHEGKIWVNSEPGKGSTFGFSLPRRQVNSIAQKKMDSRHLTEAHK